MKTIMGYESPIVPPPSDYRGEFFKGGVDDAYLVEYYRLTVLFFLGQMWLERWSESV